jgi:F-type H+-transporting ATPase subunit b
VLIDWFTIFAQIINFLILVFLLHRFLYKPILKTIDERQKRIDARWREAEQQQQEAERQAAFYRQKQQELDAQQETLLAEAKAKAEEYHQEIVKQARHEVEEMQARWRTAIEQEQEALLENLQKRIQEQTLATTRRILNTVANADLEKQAISLFIKNLESLDSEEQKNISQSISDSEYITVQSSFDIPLDTRQKIINVLQEKEIMNNHNVQFATSSDLICGIKLNLAGHAISWSFDNYLQNLEERLFKAIKS